MKKFVCLLCLFVIAVTLFASCGPAPAAQQKVIRVGYYLADGLQEVRPDGSYTGYTHEYLQAISQYTGWEYQYMIAPVGELEKMLAEGSIDIIPALPRTPEHEKIFDYPQQQSALSGTRLIVPGHNLNIAYEDFSAFDGLTVGNIKGRANSVTLREKAFLAYESAHGFNMKIKQFAVPADMLKALDSGRIDAALVSDSRRLRDYRVIANFGMTPLYFAVAKGRRDIVQGIDRAVSEIKRYDPEFDQRLASRYFSDDSDHPPVFSKRELAWLKKHKTISASYDPNFRPLEYRDERSGGHAGVMGDIFRHITDDTGIKFAFLPESSFSDSKESLKNGTCDVITILDHDYDWADKYDAGITRTIFECPVVLVLSSAVSKPDNTPFDAALTDGYYISYRYQQSHPDIKVISPKTVVGCLEAVLDGTARYTVMNAYVAEYYISRPGRYKNLEMRNVAGLRKH